MAYRAATADALGVAKVAYPMGTAGDGHPVVLTVAVAKNGVNGDCRTSFTPKSAVPGAKKLTAVITSQSQVPVALPFGVGACSPPNTSGCGSVVVTALIKGFSAFGGTPTCAGTNPSACKDYNGAVLSGQLALSWAISCPATSTTSTRDDVQTVLRPLAGSRSYKVTPVTRVNADSARLQLTADLPFAAEVAGCTVAPRLESLTITNVTLRLIGGGYPTSYFAAAGS
jgi:hypothetical protein